MVGSPQLDRNKWSVDVTVTVYDGYDNPVVDATVSGDWSGAAKGAASCVTDAGGQCMVSKGGLSTRNNSTTFTVTDIAHATLGYAPDLNAINSITVSAP